MRRPVPYAIEVQSPALQDLQDRRGAALAGWTVPLELCLSASTSCFAGVVRERWARGVHARPAAEVIRHRGRFYATVGYPGAMNDLFLPLDLVLPMLEFRP